MTQKIQIRVNGQERQLEATATLLDLLKELQLPLGTQTSPTQAFGMAIAVNDAVIPKSQLAQTQLHHLDQVEIIHPVGGG